MPENEGKSVSLTNDGHLGITFIGAGSAFSKRFYQTNMLIVKGSEHLMVDCGTRAPEALFRLGISVTQLQNFFITHCHADHIGGLEEVMLVNRYGPKKKPNIFIDPVFQDYLWDNSLRGGAAYNERKDGEYLSFEDFWNPIRPKALGDDPRLSSFSVNGTIDLVAFRTKHIPDSSATWEDSAPSFGLIIDKRVLFTSDTRYDPEMVLALDKAYKFERIFHDCQLFTGGVHASIDELNGLPATLKRKTFLVHYQDSAETQKGLAAEMGFGGFVKQWAEYKFD
jgi:ribonuclease BN (tRNA processing enzyme)